MMNALGSLAVAITAALLVAKPLPAWAQGRVSPPPGPEVREVRATPGPRYDAGGLYRLLFGSGWRDLWLHPLHLPVLDLDGFMGGLQPEKEGGGRQSITLHFVDAHGRAWIFRSMDKYPSQKLADGLDRTVAGHLIQDQIATHHPTGALMIPPLLDALGILHVEPALHVMPDDPRLGEFRKSFAGMIGMLEEKPSGGPNGTPGFAGVTKVIDTSELLEQLEESAADAVEQNELLRARLLDFIIGDTDRTMDNYAWASVPHAHIRGRRIWRPIPRDRDWAFIRADGPVAWLASSVAMKKFTRLAPEHSRLAAHTFSGHVVDRTLLTGVDRADFEREVAYVQARLDDGVIAAAVGRLPASYPLAHRRWLEDAMKARRNTLPEIASEYHEWLAGEVDVHVTDEAERVDIVRNADGTVSVTVEPRGATALTETANADVDDSAPLRPSYHRIFRPSETNEVRVFMHGGDDTAVAHGPGRGITIRVIGGGGDDVLVDSSSSGGVYLYDSRGDNRFVRGAATAIDTRDWQTPTAPESLGSAYDWAPDWGKAFALGFTADHRETVGLILGAGPTWTHYGFRRLPYHWRVNAYAITDITAPSPGAQVSADYRLENVPHSVEVDLRWSTFDAFRWFGRGNLSESAPDNASLVSMNRLSIGSSFVWRFGEWRLDDDDADRSTLESDPVRIPFRGSLALGPEVHYTRTSATPEGLFARERPLGFDPVWQAGVTARAEVRQTDRDVVPRRGYQLHATLTGYPAHIGNAGQSGTARAELNGYLPIIGAGPHLAIRAGAMRAFGEFPVFDAATIGGRSSLRGFPSNRFSGDAATFASAELRIPVGGLPLIAPGQVGLFGLIDTGRVWSKGESPGGWHVARGVGLWIETFRQVASLAYATGERSEVYLWIGLPY